MPEFSSISVIFNPNSTGPSEALAKELAEGVRKALDVDVQLMPTKHAGHAIEMASALATEHERPLIISSSGDGGYNEVINGALHAQENGAKPICAVLAAGNANDHSNSVQRRPLFDAIVSGDVEHIDVLEATIECEGERRVRYAHSYIGLGLTPAVAVELNRNHLNRLKETFIVYKTLRTLQPVEIDTNGRRLVLDSLVMANTDRMAKVLTIAENAAPDDGRFVVTTFPYRKRSRLLYMLVKAMVSGIKGKTTRQFEFAAVKDMAMQLDGEVEELHSGDRVTVTIRPKLLATLR